MARSSTILTGPSSAPRRRVTAALPASPGFIEPMLAVASSLPADVQNYNFEWKWDGVRALCHFDSRRVALRSRNKLDITSHYPELASLAAALECRSAILDGEIVAVDEMGRPSFQGLQRRMHVAAPLPALQRAVPVLYVLFDVLYIDGKSLLGLPFVERRRRLEELTVAGANWQITSAHPGEGAVMLEAARQNALEGIVAKRLDSIYEPGRRSPSWKKIKIVQRQEFVVGGWVPEAGGTAGRIGSMLIGYYDASGQLRYAGRIGTGLNAADHPRLIKLFSRHRRGTTPFNETVPRAGVQFLDPAIVVEIEYRRWPTGALVQQGAFKGVRFDKEPRQVVKERIAGDETSR